MLKLDTQSHGGVTIFGKPIRRRALGIRAEVSFVNAEEAKKLIADEGYTILDVRDKSQYGRAHIKSCFHVPLFIENQDKDLGNDYFLVTTQFYMYLICSLSSFISINISFLGAGTIVKRTLHNNFAGLFFGLPFTKPNPDFVKSIRSQFSPESKLLLVCQEGLRLVLDIVLLLIFGHPYSYQLSS